jgi:hypothetical protein
LRVELGFHLLNPEFCTSKKQINYELRPVERLEGSYLGLEEVSLTTIVRN